MISFEIRNGDEITSLTIKCPKNTKNFSFPDSLLRHFSQYSLLTTLTPACCRQVSSLTSHHSLPICVQQNLCHYLLISIIVFSKTQVIICLSVASKVVPMIRMPPIKVLNEGCSPNKINANTIPYTGSSPEIILANCVLT